MKVIQESVFQGGTGPIHIAELEGTRIILKNFETNETVREDWVYKNALERTNFNFFPEYYGVHEYKGHKYLALELIEGETLSNEKHNHDLDERMIKEIVSLQDIDVNLDTSALYNWSGSEARKQEFKMWIPLIREALKEKLLISRSDVEPILVFLEKNIYTLCETVAARSTQLIHGDFGASNVIMKGNDFKIIDWGFSGKGSVVSDIIDLYKDYTPEDQLKKTMEMTQKVSPKSVADLLENEGKLESFIASLAVIRAAVKIVFYARQASKGRTDKDWSKKFNGQMELVRFYMEYLNVA